MKRVIIVVVHVTDGTEMKMVWLYVLIATQCFSLNRRIHFGKGVK